MTNSPYSLSDIIYIMILGNLIVLLRKGALIRDEPDRLAKINYRAIDSD